MSIRRICALIVPIATILVVIARPAEAILTRHDLPIPVAQRHAEASESPSGELVVAMARSQIGVPYRFGKAEPGVGFDCSGLTSWAWGTAGVELPHKARRQLNELPPVPIADLQAGDLVFLGPGHVGIFTGQGTVIHAPRTGDVVREDPFRPERWKFATRPSPST